MVKEILEDTQQGGVETSYGCRNYDMSTENSSAIISNGRKENEGRRVFCWTGTRVPGYNTQQNVIVQRSSNNRLVKQVGTWYSVADGSDENVDMIFSSLVW